MHPDGPPEGIPFGRYRIRQRLGTGGMGEVFLADQLGPLGPVRPVALKRMRPALAHDQDLARRFLQEMGIAARLSHPNIAVTHDFGEVDGVYFMAMEYIDGAPLDRVLAAGALAVGPALLVAQRVAEALAHAHERSPPVVHQDVSPQNVMIGADGQIKLLDFGIAATEAAAQALLRAKAPYAAPEQLMGKAPERRFDLWALGVVLYEMLTGRRPFAGPTATDVLNQIQDRSVLPVEALAADTAAISPLIRRALDPVPERRWDSARAFAEACSVLLARQEDLAEKALIARIPAEQSRPQTVEATGTAAGIQPVETAETGEVADPPRWPRWPGQLAVVIAFMAAIAGGARIALRAEPLQNRKPVAVEPAKAPPPEPSTIAPKTEPPPAVAAKPTERAVRPRTRKVPVRRRPSSTQTPDRNLERRAEPPTNPRPNPTADDRFGMLSVRSTPWARVEFDGEVLGEGIIAGRPVSVGEHTVRLIPGEGGHAPRSIRVLIQPGRVTKVFADFEQDRIQVRPAN